MTRIVDWQLGSTFGPCGMKIGSSFQTPSTPNNCWGSPFQIDNICGGIVLAAKITVENFKIISDMRVKITCHCGAWRRSVTQILGPDGTVNFETFFAPDIEGYGIAPGAYRLHFELEDKKNTANISASGIIRLRPGIFKGHQNIA